MSNISFSVIICTYNRPNESKKIIDSIFNQTLLPTEILVIDGSTDNKTQEILNNYLEKISYYQVGAEHRGLTKQRNYGLRQVNDKSEVVVFLDDDLQLESDFFQELVKPFENKEVVGVDGIITNECSWELESINNKFSWRYIQLDGFQLKLSVRDLFRKFLSLYPVNLQPGKIPECGHGKSSLPQSGKLYYVDHIMGGITAYRREIFNKINFSEFFEGYGLYEDFDFSVRASEYGKLITNTAARCEHHHAPGGRPNLYKYGKMVVWNGYYVWRLKHSNPGLVNTFKWIAITVLLMFFRLGNCVTGPNRKGAFQEFFGRFVSLLRLTIQQPI